MLKKLAVVVSVIGVLVIGVSPAEAARRPLEREPTAQAAADCSTSFRSSWTGFGQSIGGMPIERGAYKSFSSRQTNSTCWTYALGGRISRIYGTVGALDSSVSTKRARLRILVDGNVRFDREVTLGSRFAFDTDTRGASQIQIRTNCVAPCSGTGQVRPAFGLTAVEREVFTDVGVAHQFYPGVNWASERGITDGYPTRTGPNPPLEFRPTNGISRQAMAAFLYRYAGEPAMLPGTPGFTDVPSTSPFARPIVWMVRSGLTSGYPDGSFRPTVTVTRQAMASFLWQRAGRPTPPAGAPNFSDVPSNHQFHTAIRWLAGRGITEGFSDGTFRPGQPVSRQAMATFLRRAWSAGVRGSELDAIPAESLQLEGGADGELEFDDTPVQDSGDAVPSDAWVDPVTAGSQHQ